MPVLPDLLRDAVGWYIALAMLAALAVGEIERGLLVLLGVERGDDGVALAPFAPAYGRTRPLSKASRALSSPRSASAARSLLRSPPRSSQYCVAKIEPVATS